MSFIPAATPARHNHSLVFLAQLDNHEPEISVLSFELFAEHVTAPLQSGACLCTTTAFRSPVSAVPAVFGLTINTPANVVECQPILFSWTGGQAPYYLTLVPGGQSMASPIKSFPTQTGTSYTWNVDLQANTILWVTLHGFLGDAQLVLPLLELKPLPLRLPLHRLRNTKIAIFLTLVIDIVLFDYLVYEYFSSIPSPDSAHCFALLNASTTPSFFPII
ncbi:hypothetical protein P692DRAFT_20955394 [Suillus brevipes Sb2]|nr:hypothetical protein P692DRAFT_20955394 [Suillus brevipes Sb2]